MTQTRTYTVPDMHCAHCERALKSEVSHVDGVEAVDVDLDRKLLTVTGDRMLDQAIREAIEEAGYEAAP